jgi:hypothetical protein
MAIFLPIAAACVQSAWVVLVKGIRLYQAMIGGEAGALVCVVLAVQAVVSFCVLRPLLRYVVLHRLAALIMFCGWLLLDFASNSAVYR